MLWKRPQKRTVNRSWEWGPKQIEGAEYLMHRGTRGSLLGMEMRLGKTDLATDKTAREYIDNREGKILVIAPEDVVDNWVETFVRVEGVERTVLLSGKSKSKREKLLAEDHDVYVVGPRGVISARLADYDWKCIILDEGHILVDPKSSFTKYMNGKRVGAVASRPPYRVRLQELVDKVRGPLRSSTHHATRKRLRRDLRELLRYRKCPQKEPKLYETIKGFERSSGQDRIVLNGNPFAEGAETIVPQIQWCMGSFMGCTDWWSWRERYMHQDPDDAHLWFLNKGVEEQIMDMANRVCFIRLRDGEGQQKQYLKVEVEVPNEILKLEKEMKKYFEADGASTMYPMTRDGYRYRLLQGHILDPELEKSHRWVGKHKAVIEFIKDCMDGANCLVWSKYTADLDLMYDLCLDAGLKPVIIDGRVKRDERAPLRDAFNAGVYDTALLQFKSCYRGLRFASAYAELYLNNPFSGDQRTQSEDRHIDAYADGLKLIVDFFVPKTLDEAVTRTAQTKRFKGKKFMASASELEEGWKRCV